MSWTDALLVWLILNELVLFVLLFREIRTLNSVASGQHHPDASAAVTLPNAQFPGVAADDPSSEGPPIYYYSLEQIWRILK